MAVVDNKVINMAEEKHEFRHILRLVDTDINGKKGLFNGLTKIKGIGSSLANVVCNLSKIPKTKKIGDLTDQEVEKLKEIIRNPSKYGIPKWMFNRRKDPQEGKDRHILTSDLRFIKDNDIKIMKKIKTYKGIRHMFNLPVRGQCTRSNFRKNKGKTTGVKRKAKSKKGK